MAGDWIKMRTSLMTNPKVNGIARELEDSKEVTKALSNGYGGVMAEIVTRSVMRHVTVSSLLVVWGAANEHTKDGVFRNADLSDLDDMTGIPGFGNAMAVVGWAIYEPESQSVTLPNFNEYNTSGSERSATAKSNAERQKEYRERQAAQKSNVTSDVTSDVTSNRREEKRREEKKEEKEKKSASAPTIPDVPESLMDDFLKVRKAKRAGPLTSTAIAGLQREADKAGLTLVDAITACCEFGWQGFNAGWYLDRQGAGKTLGGALNKQQVLEASNSAIAAKFIKEMNYAPQ